MVITTIFILLSIAARADHSEEAIYGPNRLRHNPAISIYHENDNGIPLFVEGNLSDEKARGNEADMALAYFESHRGAYKMKSPVDELQVVASQVDDLGMRHIRFEQRYKGVRVIGGELIAHFDDAGQLRTVNGFYYHDIELDVSPAVNSDAAIKIASDNLKSFFGEGQPDQSELVIFPWEDVYYLSWQVTLLSDLPLGRWEYFIDAKTGDIILSTNRIMDADDIGTGYGVMGDFRSHIDTDSIESGFQMRDYTRQADNNPHGHDGQLMPGNFIQTSIAGDFLPGEIAIDDDNFWDDPETQRPVVDAQVYTGLFYDWLLAELGRNSYNDFGASMRTSVNYSPIGENNAYWSGTQLVILIWSEGWRSLAGCPDVIGHEWSHAVTDFCSDLEYRMESGALNESFSDMMGVAFEWAHPEYDTPDWTMAENGNMAGIPFRDLESPHTYNDPDYYGTTDPYWVDVENCTPSGYNDHCGVHVNSGVGNKWFVLLSDGGIHHDVTVDGIGVANAIKIAYRANCYYWTSSTDYYLGALGTMSAADDLDPSGIWRTQVALAWTAVGVTVPGPSLRFACPAGVPIILSSAQDTTFEVTITGISHGSPVAGTGQIHYSLDGGVFVTEAMTPVSSSSYEATLPGAGCWGRYEFYFSAEEASTGIHYFPEPSSPYEAMVVDSQIIIFEDNFETDKGWTISGDAIDGWWNRGIPAGLGERGDPPTDYDGSGQCYLTDNIYGNSDVDGGTTYLNSPVFDLSGGNAEITYARWYSNDWGDAPYTDTMRVYISNNGGADWSPVETVGPVDQASGGWYIFSFMAANIVPLTDQMKLRFEVSDLGAGSIVEAALDAVRISRNSCGSEPQPIFITTRSLPQWTADYPISEHLTATGGTGAYIWADKYGDLAGTGLMLTTDGYLTGTPLAEGSISFTAEATDQGSGYDEEPFTVMINAAVSITTATLPDWTVGFSYLQQLNATGGTGSLSWSDKNGDLDGTGLSLSSTGLLSGIAATAGPISLTAVVSDRLGADDEQELSFTINDSVRIATTSLPDGEAGAPYSQQLLSSGGTTPIIWSDRDGDLDGSGLALSEGGLLSGIPLEDGEINFTVFVIDAAGCVDETPLALAVSPAYACGDANGDGETNVADAVYMINYVFKGGPAPDPVEAGDANCDGDSNIGDAVYIINYVFKGGPAPCCP